jgi:hypothetical protein
MPAMPSNGHGTDSQEVEWQFDTTDLNLVETWLLDQPASARLRFALDKDATQSDVYLDTEDWVVYRAGYALRIRNSNDCAEATLKSLETSSGAGPGCAANNSTGRRRRNGHLDSEGPVSERFGLLAGKRTLRPLFEIATHDDVSS